MAEYLNNYYVNIGSTLAKKISRTRIDPSMYIKNRNKLFLAYVNDMVNVSNIPFPILFADNMNVFFSVAKILTSLN